MTISVTTFSDIRSNAVHVYRYSGQALFVNDVRMMMSSSCIYRTHGREGFVRLLISTKITLHPQLSAQHTQSSPSTMSGITAGVKDFLKGHSKADTTEVCTERAPEVVEEHVRPQEQIETAEAIDRERHVHHHQVCHAPLHLSNHTLTIAAPSPAC